MATQQQCLRALAVHEKELSGLPHVVGLGVVPLEESKKESGGHAIGVYVDRMPPVTKSAARIPDVVRVQGKKGEIEVPVRVIETGEISLE